MNRKVLLFISLSFLFFPFFSNAQSNVTDIDGNVYPTVVIGDQEWITENLRTTRYRNGDSLLASPTGGLWENHTQGAWLLYDNDPVNEMLYGRLYNWYAVEDSRGLCPAGWSVPTDADWQELVLFADPNAWGNNNTMGTALKSRRQQNSPHGDEFATDEHPRWDAHPTRWGNDVYGFGATPGGAFVWPNGFAHKGNYGYFWSASSGDGEFALARVFMHSHRGMSRSMYKKNTALSVRCIKTSDISAYTLALQAQPTSGGTVQGAGQYIPDQQVNLTASPAEGFQFLKWSDSQNNEISTTPSFVFIMPAENTALTAVFELDEDDPDPLLPWSEDFEGQQFPPLGWQKYNLQGAFMEWDVSQAQNHTPSGMKSAIHDYGPGADGIQDGWLVTPQLLIPETGTFQLSFWSYNTWPAWYHKNSILVSTSSGDPNDGTFFEIWAAPSVSTSWVETIVSLQDYAGQAIYIAFRYEGQDAHSWFLDDVSVEEPE